jgi:hypothetical protein
MRLVQLHKLIEVLQKLIAEDHRVGRIFDQFDLRCFHDRLGGTLNGDFPSCTLIVSMLLPLSSLTVMV